MSADQDSGGSASDYIVHHITNLSVGEGFWKLHVDTLFFSIVLGLLFVGLFYRVASRAHAGVPEPLQNFIEMLVEFVDHQVKEVFHGHSRMLTPLALTIFVWVFLMNFMDLVPVDLLPAIAGAAGISHLRVVPSTDPNATIAIALTVFVLIFVYGIMGKGVRGLGREFLLHPFNNRLFIPFNLVLRVVEELRQTGLAVPAPVRQSVRRRTDFCAHRHLHPGQDPELLRGALHLGAVGNAAATGYDLGTVSHPGDHPAGIPVHDADHHLPEHGA